MSQEENILGGRVEKITLGIQTLNGEIFPSPVYRLVLNVAYGYAVGQLQKGYNIRVNYSNYFITKTSVDIETIEKAEKVFSFLQKTKALFTVTVRREKTCSGSQYVQLNETTTDTELYSLKEFKTFKGLWKTIEGEIFENKYTPSITRFSGYGLDWYVKLLPEYPLTFSQGSTITANPFATQGHLEVLKLTYDDIFAIPYYLYSRRKQVTMFNHSLQGDLVVISLGLQWKIIKVLSETQVISQDHDPIALPQGEYLFIHPRPKDRVD